MKETAIQAARRVYDIEEACIREMKEYFDEEAFGRAISLLLSAERIGCSGCGHSGILCRHFAHLMCCIDQPAKFISPAEAVHGGMGFLKENDVMVFASRGGQTAELLPMLEICRSRQIRVIAITENTQSQLATGADVVLVQHVNRESDRYNSQGTTSSTSLAVIFHVLQTAMIEETDWKIASFAVTHPGGAVGKRLNAKEK